jgi:hypothetical protein
LDIEEGWMLPVLDEIITDCCSIRARQRVNVVKQGFGRVVLEPRPSKLDAGHDISGSLLGSDSKDPSVIITFLGERQDLLGSVVALSTIRGMLLQGCVDSLLLRRLPWDGHSECLQG